MRHTEYQLLVGYARHHYAHVDPALRGHYHRVDKVVPRHEVRCAEPCVFCRLREQVDKELGAGRVSVERRVAVAEDIAVRFLRDARVNKGVAVRDRLLRKCVPEASKHPRVARGRRTCYPEAYILPVAEALLLVYIFIGNVDPAGIGDTPVHNEHLPVIPVIEIPGEHDKWIKGDAFYAALGELAHVVCVESGDAADVVIHDAHIDALPRLFRHYIDHGVPHDAVCYDEVFDENIFFSAAQVIKHIREQLITEPVVFHAFIFQERAARFSLQPAHRLGHARVGVLKLLENFGTSSDRRQLRALEKPLQYPCRAPVAEEQIQRGACQRHRQDDEQPEDLVCALIPLRDDIQYEKCADYSQNEVYHCRVR